jgi:CheY-like chemotaxis protein
VCGVLFACSHQSLDILARNRFSAGALGRPNPHPVQRSAVPRMTMVAEVGVGEDVRKRALVIDDDEIARELCVSVLEGAGYRVFELPSPIGATQTLVRQNIDVLVLDVAMPELSGDNLARLLRANERLADLVIVLVSSAAPGDLQSLARQVSADAVLSKADIRARLVETIGRAARVRQPSRKRA